MLRYVYLLLLSWLALAAHADRLPVVASFSILGDLVSQVGGDKIALTTLVGPNGDTHVYQPSPQDGKAIASAKLLFVNGLGLEGWMDRLSHASGFRGKVIISSANIAPRKASPQTDPHAWQDPDRVRTYISNIEHALAEADPANASYYHQRTQAYLHSLDDLTHWADTQIAIIPPAQRQVVTSHNAFGYLGDRFGIRFIALQGVGTESEASAKDVGNLIQQIRKDKIRTVYLENISNSRLIEQITRETGAQIGPALFSDALSKPDGPAPNYLTMMRYNIATLVAGMKQR